MLFSQIQYRLFDECIIFCYLTVCLYDKLCMSYYTLLYFFYNRFALHLILMILPPSILSLFVLWLLFDIVITGCSPSSHQQMTTAATQSILSNTSLGFTCPSMAQTLNQTPERKQQNVTYTCPIVHISMKSQTGFKVF